MEELRLWLPIAAVIASISGAWAVVRSHVQDLREKAKELAGQLDALEANHGRTSSSVASLKGQVQDALKKAENVEERQRGENGVMDRLSRLESNQVNHSRTLDDTVRRLEHVTDQLQKVMLDMAKGGPR